MCKDFVDNRQLYYKISRIASPVVFFSKNLIYVYSEMWLILWNLHYSEIIALDSWFAFLVDERITQTVTAF